MSNKVAIVRCNKYKLDLILENIEKAISLIGFDTKNLKGKTILLKPNMLGAYYPKMGITTNPTFVEACILFFKNLGCKIWIGDSGNGLFPVESVWQRTGIKDLCKKYDITQKRFEKHGSILKNGILLAKPLFEADLVVNLPKLKSHGLTILTAATKNLYGCVPGLKKTDYHRMYPDKDSFANLLVKITDTVNPHLNLVDAIVSMQGNGPAAGELIQTNMILAGINHHNIDAICCKLTGLPLLDLDTLLAAQEIGSWNIENKIEIKGEKIEDSIIHSFKLPSTYTKGMRDWWISKFVIEKIWGNLLIKPKVDKKKCIKCGLCVKSCPVNAIIMKDNKFPKVDRSKCMQCYCCHEICPNKAMKLNESFGVKIGRFLGERRINKHQE